MAVYRPSSSLWSSDSKMSIDIKGKGKSNSSYDTSARVKVRVVRSPLPSSHESSALSSVVRNRRSRRDGSSSSEDRSRSEEGSCTCSISDDEDRQHQQQQQRDGVRIDFITPDELTGDDQHDAHAHAADNDVDDESRLADPSQRDHQRHHAHHPKSLSSPSSKSLYSATSRVRRDSYMTWHDDRFEPTSRVRRGAVEPQPTSGRPHLLPSSSSPLPSLSPSRPPLFDDSEDEEDDRDSSPSHRRFYYFTDSDDEQLDDDDDYYDEDMVIKRRQVTVGRKSSITSVIRAPLKTTPLNDPLISPPPPPFPILTMGARGHKSAWLPASPSRTTVEPSPTTKSPSFNTNLSLGPSPSSDFGAATPRSTPSSSVESSPSNSPSSAQPKVSLLTKSLRSLAISLPNLQLPGLRAPLTSLDLEGLETLDRAPWSKDFNNSIPSSGSSSASSSFSTSSPIDYEAVTTIVQLKTFSSPTPPSSPAPSKPIVKSTPTPPVQIRTTRYISNQRHLLMLSLELEMMRRQKISAPLRGRAFVIRSGPGVVTPDTSASASTNGNGNGIEVGSALRWEIGA